MADLVDPSAWPSYEIGPRDSVFALGVVSVNYADLEFALAGVFAYVLGLSTSNFKWTLLSNINNYVRVKLMRQALIEIDWPDDLKEMVAHFINGFETLVANRNLLMHSNLVAGVEDQITLYKADRAGKTQLTEIGPAELRQVADDMKAYRNFGMLLIVSIELKLANALPGKKVVYGTLTKPPLPRKLDYSAQKPLT